MLFRILPAVTLVVASFALKAQTLVEKADKQYELHAYRLAAKSYETILERDPNDLAVSSRLADAYFHLNALDDAAQWYAKAVKDPKVRPIVHLNYGKVLKMLGLYDNAEAQFNAYKATDPVTATNYIKSCRFARNTEDNSSDLKIINLSRTNTSASDFGVAMFKNQLIWSSNRTDMSRKNQTTAKSNWTGSNQNQLFTAPIEDISRQPFKVAFLKNDLKNVYNESHPTYSADGKTVVFMRNNFDDGERISSDAGMELSLFTANVNDDGNWVDVTAFPHNGSGFSTGFPSLSPDGKTLYFASNRQGGQGGFDIYVSNKRGNIWAEPRNLGASINTPGEEITPFTDGKTLYFSSDYQLGYGGFDVFKTEGLGTDVVNLGTNINSSGDDFNFIFDPSVNVGFFVSNRKGSKGKEDIYRVDKLAEVANLIIVENGSPIKDAKVIVTQGNDKNLNQLKGGNWLLNLNEGKTYTIEVKKEGYKTKSLKVEPQFVKTTRNIEVSLERDLPTPMSTIPQYKGLVLDGANNQELQNVVVKATNQSNNTQMETTTDKNGQYQFNLNASSVYLITYSKEGFVIGKKTVKPSEYENKNIGEVVLSPSFLSEKTELMASVDNGMVKKSAAPRPVEIPAAYDTRPTKVTPKAPEERVYAVQLFVSSSDEVLNLSRYDDLKSIGNLYIAPENGKQKVRLGVYATRDVAYTALEKVKAKGFTNAFTVEEKNERAIETNGFKPVTVAKTPSEETETPLPKPISMTAKSPVKTEKPLPKPKTTKPAPVTTTSKTPQVVAKTPKPVEKPNSYNTVVKPKTNTTAPSKVVKKVEVEDKTFKVKIAAMSKPEWFDDSKVSTLWKIDQIVDGDLTLFIMDGFKTLQQAKDIKAKVKAAGYKDAKVVIRDGTKFKVVD